MALFDFLKKGEGPIARMRSTPALDKELLTALKRNLKEDERDYPEDAAELTVFASTLHNQIEQHVKHFVAGGSAEGGTPSKVSAALTSHISPDQMTAYICLLPPLGEGNHATVEGVLSDLRLEGIVHGIEIKRIEYAVTREQYLHIIPIAKGLPPTNGQDAKIDTLLEPSAMFELEMPTPDKGGSKIVDFDGIAPIQAVRKGVTLCRRQPDVPPVDGIDVAGRTVPGLSGQPRPLSGGKNTTISPDGLSLTAKTDGFLHVRDGSFYVEPQHVVFGDVDTENIDHSGSVLIKGNVADGMTVKATGNIIIEGAVGKATIIAKGSVFIRDGVSGQGSVRANRQVQCKMITEATVVAGGNVYAETVVDSDVASEDSVYILGGRGLLIGGQVKARHVVEAQRVGNQAGTLNRIFLNYNPILQDKADKMHEEMGKMRATLADLQKHITSLRMRSGTQMPPDQRELLARLVEQRTLYEKQIADLDAQARQLGDELRGSKCWLASDEILPATTVTLGKKSTLIKTPQRRCRVLLSAGELVVQ